MLSEGVKLILIVSGILIPILIIITLYYYYTNQSSTTDPITPPITPPTPFYIKSSTYGFGRYNPDAPLVNSINPTKAVNLSDSENNKFQYIDIVEDYNGTLDQCKTHCDDNIDCGAFGRSNTTLDSKIASCYFKKQLPMDDTNNYILSNRIGTPYNIWIKTTKTPLTIKNANGEIITLNK
jgi:hypothetical protein